MSASIPPRGAMSYAQASGAGTGAGSGSTPPVNKVKAAAMAASTGGASPSKAWGSPTSFLAVASAANKNIPSNDSKPPAAPQVPLTDATKVSQQKTQPEPRGGHQSSEVDGSVNGGAERSNWVCPTCKKVVFGRKTTCYKCKTDRPANPVLAPSQAAGASGKWLGGQ